MSAVPRRQLAPPPATASAKPKLVVRPRGTFHGLTRSDVAERLHRSKWNFMALIPDLFRIVSGASEAGFLTLVHFQSKGAPRSKTSRPSEWTPVLLPEDQAKALGFSAQQMREADEAMIEAGFVIRKAEEGEDRYRFKLDGSAIQKARNAFSPRDGAFRKPPSTAIGLDDAPESGVEEAKEDAESMTSEESRATAIARPVSIPAGRKAEIPGMALVCRNRTAIDVTIASRQTKSGKVQIDLFSRGSMGEPQAGTAAGDCTSAVSGAGMAKIVGVIAPADGSAPAPGHPCLPFSDDPLTAGLGQLGLPPDDDMLERVRRELRCNVPFLLEVIGERVNRAKERREVITLALLPRLVANANQRWKNGGQALWEAREQQEREVQVNAARAAEAASAWVNEPPPMAERLALARQGLAAAKRVGNKAEVTRLQAIIAELERS